MCARSLCRELASVAVVSSGGPAADGDDDGRAEEVRKRRAEMRLVFAVSRAIRAAGGGLRLSALGTHVEVAAAVREARLVSPELQAGLKPFLAARRGFIIEEGRSQGGEVARLRTAVASASSAASARQGALEVDLRNFFVRFPMDENARGKVSRAPSAVIRAFLDEFAPRRPAIGDYSALAVSFLGAVRRRKKG